LAQDIPQKGSTPSQPPASLQPADEENPSAPNTNAPSITKDSIAGPTDKNMPANKAKFLDGDLMNHVIVMSLSSSVGLVSMFFVDFLDLYFISLLGDSALTAAAGFAGTLLYFNMSITVGLMIATGALASRRIGAGDLEGARRIATNVMAIGCVVGVVFSLFFWIFTPDLLELVGASGEAKQAAIRYLRIVVPAMPIMVIGMVCSGVLRAHGDAKRAMNSTLSMGITNAVLDPIFIFGLNMGLEGAAMASVTARFALMLSTLIPVLKIYGGFTRFEMASLRRNIKSIMGIVGPAILTNIATPVGVVFVTRTIAAYGDMAVAGYSVIARLMPLAYCVIFALSGAVGPIIGQNYGALRYDRVRGTLRKSIQFAGAYTFAAWILLFLSHGFIADQFGLTGIGRSLLFWFGAIAAPLMLFNGILFVTNAACNNLDRPLWSTILNWGRNTIGIVPFVWIGARIADAPGVLIGQYAGSILFAALGVFLVNRLIDDYEAGRLSPKRD